MHFSLPYRCRIINFLFPGVDENTIIEILVKRSNAQRQQIKEAYQQASGKVNTITYRISYQKLKLGMKIAKVQLCT